MRVGAGEVDLYEARDLQRRWQKNADDWHEESRMVIGASKEHPDGIEARTPADTVCMTEDEFRHWFPEK